MAEWDLGFKASTEVIECCPYCADEIMVDGDGTSTCPECGHENVLPCSACKDYNSMEMCDWEPILRCTPFRLEKPNVT